MSFTEEEFLSVIADGNQSKMQIGALITLSNTYCDTYEVIGVNHDGTTGTVDIMSHIQVGQVLTKNNNKVDYSQSGTRTYVNGTFFNAFSSNIRNAAKTMTVNTNYNNSTTGYITTYDKVKVPSSSEIGVTNTNFSYPNNGTFYDGVFTSGTSSTAILDRWRDAGTYGFQYRYWLRDRYHPTMSHIWVVAYNGVMSHWDITYSGYQNDPNGVLAIMRF